MTGVQTCALPISSGPPHLESSYNSTSLDDLALLDVSKVKLGEDGKLTGWDDQIKAIQKSDAYLFNTKQQNSFRGLQPGVSGDDKPGTKVDMSKMTYEELAAYMENNPGEV